MSPPDKVERHHKRPNDSKYNLLELGVIPLVNPFLVGNGDSNQINQDNQITIPCHSLIVFNQLLFSLNLSVIFQLCREHPSRVVDQLNLTVGKLYSGKRVFIQVLPTPTKVFP